MGEFIVRTIRTVTTREVRFYVWTCPTCSKEREIQRGVNVDPTRTPLPIYCSKRCVPSYWGGYVRHNRALEMRKEGKTFREIGEEFGVSSTRARDMFQKAEAIERRVLRAQTRGDQDDL